MFGANFTQPQQFLEAWTKMSAEQMARIEKMTSEYEGLQEKALARAIEAIDESSRLFKESLTYAARLSDEWRKVTIEAGKKAAEATTPKA